MSKDIKPKHRLGQTAASRRKRAITWVVLTLMAGGGAYAAYHYGQEKTTVEVPVAKVRRSEFVISVKTRGEIRSVRSEILTAPQVPDPRIVRLAESGKPIKKGEVVVEFDAAQQEQTYLEKNTSVRTADSEIVQTKASHRIVTEQDGMNQMTAEYNLERSKLDASKAEVVSQIEGAKSRIDVGVSQGELGQVKTVVGAHKTTQQADLDRLQQKKDKVVRDADRAKGYLSKMVLLAPKTASLTCCRTSGRRAPSAPPRLLSRKAIVPGPEPPSRRSRIFPKCGSI
jgi:hypothetical protein